MLVFNCLSYTVVQYGLFLLALLFLSLMIYTIVKKISRIAGKVFFVIVISGFLYGALCEYPRFDFFGLVRNGVATEEKLIALTFDDGPSAKYTPIILNELNKNKSHATFFVTGENAEKHPEIIKEIVRNGNELGNHTYSHSFMFKDLSKLRREEIIKADDVVYKITGEHMKYFRAPYEYRDVRLIKLLRRMGYIYISHNESTLDAMGASSERITDQVLKKLKPGKIFLMHDARGNREETVKALKVLLPRLRKMGYRAVTIDELIQAKKLQYIN